MAENMGAVAKGSIDLDLSKLTASVSQGVKQLQRLQKEDQLLNSEMEKLQALSDGVGNSFDRNRQKTALLSKQLSGAKQQVSLYQKGIQDLTNTIQLDQKKQQELLTDLNKAKQAYNQAKDSLDSMTSSYKSAQKEINNATKQYGKNSDEVEKVRTKHKDLIESYEGLKQKTREYQNQMLQLGSEYDRLDLDIKQSKDQIMDYKIAINTTSTEIANLSKEMYQSRSRLVQLSDYLEKGADSLQSYADKASKAGNTLSAVVTAPILTAGVTSAKLAMDAETSYAKVSTLMDETIVSYENMTQSVAEASDATGIAVADFNEALYESLSAGVESGSSIQFTLDMAKLAKGGFTDLAKSVDIVTTVLNAYGLSADQAVDISDKLIVTQDLGKTTVDELAATLGRTIPTAKNLNVEFADVAAAMAVLTKNGIQTSEATTYYNAMLNELGKSGTDADKALRELSGKGFAELIKEGTSVTDVLKLLQTFAESNEKSLSDMFGSAEAGKAALTIMKEDGAEYNEILQEMEQSAGATQRAFDKMDATKAADMQKELNKMKNVAISVGQKLFPLVTRGLEAVDDLIDAFNELTPEQQDAILKTAGIAAAMGPMIKATSTAAKGMKNLTTFADFCAKKLAKKGAAKVATKELESVASAATGATSNLGGLSSILGGLATPAGVAIGAAVATGTAIVGIGAAIDKMEEKYAKADLERRFGDISLSAEEIDKAVEGLTKNGNVDAAITKLEQMADTKEKLNDLNETVEELEKQNYLIQVGIGLDEEDTASFESNINTLIGQAQDIVNQTKLQIPMQLDFLSSSDLSGVMSGFSVYESQVNTIAQTLKDSMTKALEDNIVTAEESANIQPLIYQLQEKINVVADAEYTAKLDKLKVDMGDLTPESYKGFMEKFQETTDEQIQTLEDNQYQTEVLLNVLLKEGIIDQTKYDQFLEESRKELENQKMEITVGKGIEYTLDPIRSRYSEELKKASREMYDDTTTIINGIEMDLSEAIKDGSAENLNDAFNGMYTEISQGFANLELDDGARDAIAQLYNQLQPTKEQLESIAQSAREAGERVPSSVVTALSDINNLGAIAGKEDAIWYMIGEKARDDPAVQEMLLKMQERGLSIPTEVANAISNNSNLVYDATTNQWQQVIYATENTPISGTAATMVKKMRDTTIAEIDGISSDTIAALDKLNLHTTTSMASNIASGNLENIEIVRNEGTKQVEGFRLGAEGEIVKATPDLLELFGKLGIYTGDEYGNKLRDRELQLPKVNPITDDEAKDTVDKTHKELQKHADKNPVKIPVELDPMVNGNHIRVDFDVSAVSSSGRSAAQPSAQSRAVMGVNSYSFATPASELASYGINPVDVAVGPLPYDFTPSQEEARSQMVSTVSFSSPSYSSVIDYKRLAKEIVAALQEAPIETHVEVFNDNKLSVDLDGELVGRAVSPTVSRIISKNF